MGALIFLAALVLALLAWLAVTYNRLVTLRNLLENAWAQIDVQLRRRHDLIPNLVETVKGYAAHEKATFENVIAARAAAMGAVSPAAKAEAETALTGALKSLFAVAEAYPELKANQNFLRLQQELAGTENLISESRSYYNRSVADFNTAAQVFPANLVAGLLGFGAREYFELPGGAEREPAQVQF
jgi:LemA protein